MSSHSSGGGLSTVDIDSPHPCSGTNVAVPAEWSEKDKVRVAYLRGILFATSMPGNRQLLISGIEFGDLFAGWSMRKDGIRVGDAEADEPADYHSLPGLLKIIISYGALNQHREFVSAGVECEGSYKILFKKMRLAASLDLSDELAKRLFELEDDNGDTDEVSGPELNAEYAMTLYDDIRYRARLQNVSMLEMVQKFKEYYELVFQCLYHGNLDIEIIMKGRKKELL